MSLSEMGLGTYLGDLDEQTRHSYQETIVEAIESGVNVIDAAINYRNMLSEKDIAIALKKSKIPREDLIISTKGGFVPYDNDAEQEYPDYAQETFLRPALVPREDLPYRHSLDLKFIEWAFNKSLENLAVDYIDVYFLHNPEGYLQRAGKDKFYFYLKDNFSMLEDQVRNGKLRYYGLATWDGFRVDPSKDNYLDLQEIVQLAIDVAGNKHHMKFIQLPYNLHMHQAYTFANQSLAGKTVPTFAAAAELGVYAYTSASLLQGQSVKSYDESLYQLLKVEKDAHVPIQFARSTPNIGTYLIGTSQQGHLKENLEVLSRDTLAEEDLKSAFAIK